jgi:hypothetical protein
MATIPAFKINGLLDTSKTVLSNLNALAKASGCWLTYDSTTGQWAVIINRPGDSTKSFNDSNIIGAISVTGTGVDQLYNAVSVQYPNADLMSTTDSANFELTSNYRFPNELDKRLTLQYDLISNPIQAQYLGIIELKQNRVDKIIQFRTDYTSLGIKAGDLMDITNSVYGYTNKVFRVTKVAEEDADDGSIQLSITGLEYDATVYDTSGLVYSARTTSTGVVPKSMNTALNAFDKASLTNVVFSFNAGGFAAEGVSHTTTDQDFFLSNPNAMVFYGLGYSTKLPYTGRYLLTYNVNWGSAFNISGGSFGLPATIRKNTAIAITKNGTGSTLAASSIAKGIDPNADTILDGYFTGTAGDTVVFGIGIASDLTQTSPGTFTGANTTSSTIATSGLLTYLGA